MAFMNSLAGMLKPGGYGLISAAMNPLDADHIYLYRNSEEVAEQLVGAGFVIVDSSVDAVTFPKKEGNLRACKCCLYCGQGNRKKREC